MMHHELLFGEHRFLTAGDAALYWPAQSMMLVADLHLEKASSFASGGQMLPPYDSLATLEELAKLAQLLGAHAITCLGDNFHDSAGEARLSGEASALLRKLTLQYDWTWITGNHDPALEAIWGGRSIIEYELDGIMLRHQAEPMYTAPEISGHFHPKVRISARGRSIPRRCFLIAANKLIMPAFGALTGGMDAAEAAILAQPSLKHSGTAEALIATSKHLAKFSLKL
jgi:uncharacterized protein